MKRYYVIRQSVNDYTDSEYCYNNEDRSNLILNASIEFSLEEAESCKKDLDMIYGQSHIYTIYEILGDQNE